VDGERESLETKDGDRESLETKDGERESLETEDGDREKSRDKQKSLTTKNRHLGEESCLRPSVPCSTKQDLA